MVNASIVQQTSPESLEMTNDNNGNRAKTKVCYYRVRSEHQRGDFEQQMADLQQLFRRREILSDFGSGLNWKRRGFTALLELV